jgi:microcystin-dependent protein
MARSWNASDATPGTDIESTQYNDLRDDIEAVYQEVVPVGTITMWAGSDANVPTNWLLCDGSTISRSTYATLFTALGSGFGGGDGSTTFNIPDMRDRFVVGAGTTYSRNSKGGSASVTLSTAQLAAHTHTGPSHTHSGPSHTHSGPSHTHSFSATSGGQSASHMHTSASDYDKRWYGGAGPSTEWPSYANAGNGFGTYGINTLTGWADRDHTHSVSGTTGAGGTGNTGSGGTGNTGASGTGASGSSGSGSSHENRPPYIGIFYIIKALQEE